MTTTAPKLTSDEFKRFLGQAVAGEAEAFTPGGFRVPTIRSSEPGSPSLTPTLPELTPTRSCPAITLRPFSSQLFGLISGPLEQNLARPEARE